jgi:hypothetical protein
MVCKNDNDMTLSSMALSFMVSGAYLFYIQNHPSDHPWVVCKTGMPLSCVYAHEYSRTIGLSCSSLSHTFHQKP